MIIYDRVTMQCDVELDITPKAMCQWQSCWSTTASSQSVLKAFGRRLKTEEDVSANAGGILELIVDKFVGKSTYKFEIPVQSTQILFVTLRNGSLVAEFYKQCHFSRTLGSILGGKVVPLHEAMIKLFAALGLKKNRKHAWLMHLYTELLSILAAEVEQSRDDKAVWEAYTHADMPACYRTGSAKPRVMGTSCKMAIIQLIEKEPEISDARQLFGAKIALKSSMDVRTATGKSNAKNKRRFGIVMKKHGCRNLQYTEASQYNAAG